MRVVAAGAHEHDSGSPIPRYPRGRRRTPSPSSAKLQLTRRAWLLLWLTATLIALADGGLLLQESSVTVVVEGRSRSLPAGLTVEQALERLWEPVGRGSADG